MISLEKFKLIVDQLQKNIEYLNKVCELVGNPDLVFEHACIDETVIALAAAMHCDEELLFKWIFECDFGKEWGDPYVIAYGAELKTAEQLYDYLVDLRHRETAEKRIFCVPGRSGFSDCPDFELTYHPADNYYTMSMETIYQMHKDETGAYVNDIWKQFTDWMIDNGHSINEPVPLYVFESGVNLHTPYLSIADAYAAFTVLAAGASAQGVVSEW